MEKKKWNTVKGLWIRKQLKMLPEFSHLKQKILKIKYDFSKDKGLPPLDKFGPLTSPDYLTLPKDVGVSFVATSDNIS